MPCSAMMRAASWARATRTWSVRLECRRGIGGVSEERFVVLAVFVLRALAGIILTCFWRWWQVPFDHNLENRIRIVAAGQLARRRGDAHGHEAGRHRAALLGDAAHRLEHEIGPGRNRRAPAFLAGAERTLVVEADPDGRDQV